MNNLLESFIYIGSGLLLTLELLIGGMILSVITGTLIAVLRYNHVLPRVWISYISLIRGTPIILQLSFIYFAVPTAFGLRLDIVLAGILTFGLNSSAYISEILRAGIENLPQGQFEAARTLQIPSYYMWKDIILPQVVRNIGPGMVNETISLMKETALIATIGGLDIMRQSQLLAAEQFTYFIPLCMAGAYYYGMTLLIEFFGGKIVKGGSYVTS